MRSLIKRFLRHERGGIAVEYAILVVFIALVAAVGAQAFGTGLKTWFTAAGASIGGLNSAIP